MDINKGTFHKSTLCWILNSPFICQIKYFLIRILSPVTVYNIWHWHWVSDCMMHKPSDNVHCIVDMSHLLLWIDYHHKIIKVWKLFQKNKTLWFLNVVRSLAPCVTSMWPRTSRGVHLKASTWCLLLVSLLALHLLLTSPATGGPGDTGSPEAEVQLTNQNALLVLLILTKSI